MHINHFSLTAVAAATAVSASSLKDIKHIVLFMQENRAFDHVSPRSLLCLLQRV
jgi:phospholipase C